MIPAPSHPLTVQPQRDQKPPLPDRAREASRGPAAVHGRADPAAGPDRWMPNPPHQVTTLRRPPRSLRAVHPSAHCPPTILQARPDSPGPDEAVPRFLRRQSPSSPSDARTWRRSPPEARGFLQICGPARPPPPRPGRSGEPRRLSRSLPKTPRGRLDIWKYGFRSRQPAEQGLQCRGYTLGVLRQAVTAFKAAAE